MAAPEGDALPKPRPGVMPARAPSSAPATSRVEESATQYVAGAAALGGPLSLLANDRGILRLVRDGLPFSMLEELASAVGGSQQQLAKVIGIPATTLGRRKRTGRLTPAESDRLVRIARLQSMARTLMRGDAPAARRWLTTPHALLGEETPLHHASTETGGREVEQLIGRLRHGVFS